MGHRLLPNTPELYHGTEKSRPYFEGWYFKQVSDTYTFSVIPGVFRGKTKDEDIAFIQLIFGTSKTYFLPFSYNEFKYNNHKFELWIADCFFSQEKVIINISREGICLDAHLDFRGITPLDTTLLSPSIMGPFAYMPGMQCNHGVLSLKHHVNGVINIGDEHIHLEDAHGYIEKDWGEAFPDAWIWMQCNDEETSLMCSVASIAYGLLAFTGLICVLLVGNKQYRFATYNGAKVTTIKKTGKHIFVEIKKRRYRLVIRANSEYFGTLKAPTRTGMDRDIAESVVASYHFALYHNNKEICTHQFENGGLEMLSPNKLMKKKTTKF